MSEVIVGIGAYFYFPSEGFLTGLILFSPALSIVGGLFLLWRLKRRLSPGPLELRSEGDAFEIRHREKRHAIGRHPELWVAITMPEDDQVYGEALVYKADTPASEWTMLTPDELRKIKHHLETHLPEANVSTVRR